MGRQARRLRRRGAGGDGRETDMKEKRRERERVAGGVAEEVQRQGGKCMTSE